MTNRAIVYATVVLVLVLGCYQYLSTKRLSEVQNQYRRVADQADTIKAEERKIDSLQQQVEGLQQELQVQNEELQERLKRIEGELRAQRRREIEPAATPHLVVLRIYPLWIAPNGAVECNPTLNQTCYAFNLGKEVNIGITLTNLTGHSISYPRWFGPPTFLVIRDRSGRVISEAAELNALRNRYPPPEDAALKPDGQISWGIPVNKYRDMSRPGAYSIIAKMPGVEQGKPWLYSNQIRVTIRPKPLSPTMPCRDE